MEFYVWRHGPAAERSIKPQTPQQSIVLQEGPEFHKDTMLSTGLDKIEIALQMNEHTQPSRLRENVNNKLHERHMIQQVGLNPYFQGSNYIDDLNIQETFLRPRESNSEIKGTN